MKNDRKIKILKINPTSFLDYPDNESLAVIIYILGCRHFCKGCQNPELQNFNLKSKIFEEVTLNEFKKKVAVFSGKAKTNKIVLSGGDPFYFRNLNFVSEFLNSTNYDVCIYTGHSIDYVKALNISHFKFLKCGKYNLNLKQVPEKTDSYIQFASKNQKLYDSNFKLLSKNGRYYFKD